MGRNANNGNTGLGQSLHNASGADRARFNNVNNAIGRARTRFGAGTSGRDTLGGTVVRAAPAGRLQSSASRVKFPFMVSIINQDDEDYVWIERLPSNDSAKPSIPDVDIRKVGLDEVWADYTEGFDTPFDDSDTTSLGFKSEVEGGESTFVYLEAEWDSATEEFPIVFKPVNYSEFKPLVETMSGENSEGDTVEFQSISRKLIAKITRDPIDGSDEFVVTQYVKDVMQAGSRLIDGLFAVKFEPYE